MEPRKSKVGHVKEHGGSYLKLAAAIGALATAVNGYVELQRNQEALLETMSTQLNALTAKVSYLEGRLERNVGPSRPQRKDEAYRKVPSSFEELRKAVKARREGRDVDGRP